MSVADPGKISGILAVLGQNFYENGQRIAVTRADIEEEIGEDLRDELLFLTAADITEVFSSEEKLYVDLEREKMRSALSEREKLEQRYSGEIQDLVENESPTFIDYNDDKPEMEPDFNVEVPGKFFYNDYAGLVATIGCFGQEKENYTWEEIAGYINEDPTPHLKVLEATSYLKSDPYRLIDESYIRDAERINQFIQDNYDGFTHEFQENFSNQRMEIDALLESLDLSEV